MPTFNPPNARKDSAGNGQSQMVRGGRTPYTAYKNSYKGLNRKEKSVALSVLICLITTIYWESTGTTSLLQIGSFNLTCLEFVFATSLLAVIANSADLVIRFRLYTLFSAAALLIFTCNLFRGLFVDPTEALTSVRKTGSLAFFLLLAPIFADSNKLKRFILKILIASSTILSTLVVVRRTTGLLWTEIAQNDGRPILAWGGFIIVLGCIVLASRAFSAQRSRSALTLLSLNYCGILLSGQGTGNLCALLGVSLVLALEPGPSRNLRLLFAGGIAATAIAILIISPQIFSLNTLSGTGSSDFDAFLTQRSGTNETRQLVWKGLWISYQRWSELEKILGLPSGVKPVIWIPLWNGTYWKFGMHSMYLQTLVLQGMLGLILYVLLFVVLLPFSIWRALSTVPSNESPISPAASAALLAALALFGYSYDLGGELAPYLMLGFGSVLSSGRPLPRRAGSMSRFLAISNAH